MNKTQSLKHFVYLVGLHIYYKMIHGPYNIKLMQMDNLRFYINCVHLVVYVGDCNHNTRNEHHISKVIVLRHIATKTRVSVN